MYRDFSNSAKQKLLDQVAQVENERKSSIEECFGSKWYVFQSWADVLNIKRYFNNVLIYHQKVFEKNTATKTSINKLFFYVGRVDKSIKSKLSQKREKIHSLTELIEELSKIVNPANGQFSMDDANGFLATIFKKVNANENISDYFCVGEDNKKQYNWKNIHHLLTKDKEDLTEKEWMILFALLGSFSDEDENTIDVENLEKFLSAGFTDPAEITADDYHCNWDSSLVERGCDSYYLQNKSYMTDTMKALLETSIFVQGISNGNDGIKEHYNVVERRMLPILKAFYQNFQVIEWREEFMRHSETAAAISGKPYLNDMTLSFFNIECVPKISLKYISNCHGSEMDCYEIKSNAFNRGNIYATEEIRNKTLIGTFVGSQYVETDDYSDCTIEVYVDCVGSSDASAQYLMDKPIINSFREEFDTDKAVMDSVMEVVELVPVVGKGISYVYKLCTSTDYFDVASTATSSAKSADLKTNGISEVSETKLDNGLSVGGTVIDYIKKYMDTKKNNDEVDSGIKKSEMFLDSLIKKENLGFKYDTMVVKYDHVTYKTSLAGYKTTEVNKNCDNSECVISIDWYYDTATLNSNATSFCDQEADREGSKPEIVFEQLDKDVQDFLKSGNESELLIRYMKSKEKSN